MTPQERGRFVHDVFCEFFSQWQAHGHGAITTANLGDAVEMFRDVAERHLETLAEAERLRIIREAEGRATALRAQGEAEAEIIYKKGEAEAKAMNVKAEAYQEWNQSAVVDKLITGMPEVVRALAEPLGRVDKITVISTGGDSTGMNKVTGDLTQIAAQIPALFETLSGMQMSELLGKVRPIGDKTPKPDKARTIGAD